MTEPVRDVLIEDESLRDGLQGEKRMFSVEEKLRFLRGMEACGVRRIQVGSFVHPKWVPQMANTDELFAVLEPRPDVLHTALVLNMKGVERALACGARHLSMSVSASETHNRKNTNRSLSDAKAEIRPMIERAKAEGLKVRAGVMTAMGCAYEGAIDPGVVEEIAALYGELGVDEVNIADSTGMGNPRLVRDLVDRVRRVVPAGTVLSLHLHDTRGLGLANMVAGVDAGVRNFDTSLGGLGGCPFIPGAAGNIATEDAAYALSEMGIATGIDGPRLCDLAIEMEGLLGRTLPGRMAHLPRPGARGA